jgi:hypothetical protein
MQLIQHYDRTGHIWALTPIVQKLIPILPRQAGIWITPSDDYVLGALVKTIIAHDPHHACATQYRQSLRQTHLCHYPPKEPTTLKLCLMTY